MEAVLSRLEEGFATAAMLAETAGVCERSVYRYVEALRDVGEPIISEAGCGYLLRRRRR
jgi:predicted DNA-binding transcriptional regulator YafY